MISFLRRFLVLSLLPCGFALSSGSPNNEAGVSSSQDQRVLQHLLMNHFSNDEDDHARLLQDDFAPCLVCEGNSTSTPNDQFIIPGLTEEEDLTCLEVLMVGMQGGAIPIEFCPFITDFFLQSCTCGIPEPTVSPNPTESASPSLAPSLSLTPTASPCFLCGAEGATIPPEYHEVFVLVPELGFEVPCIFLEEILESGIPPPPGMDCTDIHTAGQQCGCLPVEPTVSPAPTTSLHPSGAPSSSPYPTAGPCFLCGSDEVTYEELDYEKIVDVPVLGPTPCIVLADFGYFGYLPEQVECIDIQAFGQECGCPSTEPTSSPAPSVSESPSVSPTNTASPSAPCSCQGNCHGIHSNCACYCDALCKTYDDCCDDVDDHCKFEPSPPAGAPVLMESAPVLWG